jgi:hypothetical protein
VSRSVTELGIRIISGTFVALWTIRARPLYVVRMTDPQIVKVTMSSNDKALPAPAGSHVDALLSILKAQAFSLEDDDSRRSEIDLAPWWQLDINELAPVRVEASTKLSYTTERDAFDATLALRDALVSTSDWTVVSPVRLGVFGVGDGGEADPVVDWFGWIKIRLIPSSAD